MIVRETTEGLYLISQVDHARLAGELAGAWGNDRIPGLPLADWLVPSIRDHDEGWRTWEQTPDVTDGGRPRAFTEMPADVATAIWSTSIDVCASGPLSSAEGLRKLRRDYGELTPDDAAVLKAVLRHRGSFDVGRLRSEIIGDDEISDDAFAATLSKLERCGAILPLAAAVGGPAYAIALPSTGGSPLGGIWVSRHFCALAETTKENRADAPEEQAVFAAFLERQATNQLRWVGAIRDFAGEELTRVLDTGFRYVRFFDRISLWLSMADRSERWEVPLSSSLMLAFTPRTPREIEVSPWPFGPAALELSVPALKIPAAEFEDAAALHEAIAAAERTMLRWVLVRE